MSDDQIGDDRDSPDRAQPAAADERDATIARLERAVADERQNSARLRATIEELRFKVEVLERSYSKQLQDARRRSATAEQELAEHRARLAALGDGHEDTLSVLTELRTELERVTADREQLRRQLARLDRSSTRSVTQDRWASPAEEAGSTINDLLALDYPPSERQRVIEENSWDALVGEEQESVPGDMIAPELVFPGRRDDSEES